MYQSGHRKREDNEELNRSTVVCKLDINITGFHHIELEEGFRDITTFSVDVSLFLYTEVDELWYKLPL